jgi:hypothetical protein
VAEADAGEIIPNALSFARPILVAAWAARGVVGIVSPDDGSHAPLGSSPVTAPGDHLRRSLTLPAGRYLLWCSLEGQEAAGMSVRLRVE